MKNIMGIFSLKITRDKCKDAGMAFVLILLILNFTFKVDFLIVLSIALLLITMAVPQIYKPLAAIWFGLAQVLGTVASKIILSVVYFAIVTPVAVVRRLLRKDSLKLKEFKKSQESVMEKRNITFGPKDIEHPF